MDSYQRPGPSSITIPETLGPLIDDFIFPPPPPPPVENCFRRAVCVLFVPEKHAYLAHIKAAHAISDAGRIALHNRGAGNTKRNVSSKSVAARGHVSTFPDTRHVRKISKLASLESGLLTIKKSSNKSTTSELQCARSLYSLTKGEEETMIVKQVVCKSKETRARRDNIAFYSCNRGS